MIRHPYIFIRSRRPDLPHRHDKNKTAAAKCEKSEQAASKPEKSRQTAAKPEKIRADGRKPGKIRADGLKKSDRISARKTEDVLFPGPSAFFCEG